MQAVTAFADPNPTMTHAILAAARATHLVQNDARREDSWAKEDRTPVTVADLTSQALVLGALMESVPGERVIAEEEALVDDDDPKLARIRKLYEEVTGGSFSLEEMNKRIGHRGDPESRQRWFVDPIDGTKGFLNGLAYAIGVARAVEGELVQSWLAVPGGEELLPKTSGKLFIAVKGQGAFVRPLVGQGDWRAVHAPQEVPDEIAVVGSRAHGKGMGPEELRAAGLKARFQPLDSMGKYAAVAVGEAHVYVREPHPGFGPNLVWDHAAGSLLVREAGGVATDLSGKAFEFTHGARLEANSGVLATCCASLHDTMRELLSHV